MSDRPFDSFFANAIRSTKRKPVKEVPPCLLYYKIYVMMLNEECNNFEMISCTMMNKNQVDIKEVACGTGHILVLDQTGSVYSGGYSNFYGEFGREEMSTYTNDIILEKIELGVRVKSIHAVYNCSQLTSEDGKCYVFGCNNWKHLHPIGPFVLPKTPQLVDFGFDYIIELFKIGSNHSLMVINKKLYSFGCGDCGQLGRTTDHQALRSYKMNKSMDKFLQCHNVKFFNEKVVSTIACGDEQSAVILADGDLFCFGKGASGSLSLSNTLTMLEAVKAPTRVVLPLTNGARFYNMALGYTHAIYSTINQSSQELYVCGSNVDGKLGLENGFQTEPLLVPLKSDQFWRKVNNVKMFGLGNTFSMIQTGDGKLIVCGNYKIDGRTNKNCFTVLYHNYNTFDLRREIIIHASCSDGLIVFTTRHYWTDGKTWKFGDTHLWNFNLFITIPHYKSDVVITTVS